MPKVVLVLDAGHGGIDPGATARYPEFHGGRIIREKWLAWDFCKRVKAAAKDSNLTVHIVPHDKDTDSPNRSRFINRVKWSNAKSPHLFVSVHWNAATSSVSGEECWHQSNHNASKNWGVYLSGRMSAAMKNRDRGSKPDSQNRWGRLGVLHGHVATTTHCLMELGFISNKSDYQRWHDHADEIVDAFIDACLEYQPIK
jgi:N-acetylmuramoyl-L-alanine amidase